MNYHFLQNTSEKFINIFSFELKYFRQDLSELDSSIKGDYTFTSKWLKQYLTFDVTCTMEGIEDCTLPEIPGVSIVFLAGGTCRIPFIKKKIQKTFPGSKLIIDDKLEVITAEGAATHALQVLNGEVEPYIKIIK